MTLRHIKIFVAVCDTGSTVQAAAQQHITQPAVSLAIKELENFYGIKLFDRISRHLVLTSTGKHFLTYARKINDSFLSLETQIKDYDAIGDLVVGASITIGMFLLAPLIHSFKLTNPETNVLVQIRDTASIENLITANKLDIGLVESPIKTPALTSIPFYEDSLQLFTAKNHPFALKKSVTLADIASQPLILRESPSAGRNLIDSVFASRDILMNIIWESVSYDAIIAAVEENLGVTIIPQSLQKLNTNIVCIPISDASFFRTYSIIHHKNKYITKGAHDFIELCTSKN